MLTDSQVLALCSELNHLLWTDDSPELDPTVLETIRKEKIPFIQPKGNMQCSLHAAICAGLMWRQGEKVTTRGGSVLIVYPEQHKHDSPHFITKHWWITTSNGLFDLSLNLRGFSDHKPIVFRNINLADPSWQIVFKDDFRQIVGASAKSQATGIFGVFYQTDKKLLITKEIIEPDLLKPFTLAKAKNIEVRLLDVVLHCERFINGGGSLQHLPQEVAWKVLAKESKQFGKESL